MPAIAATTVNIFIVNYIKYNKAAGVKVEFVSVIELPTISALSLLRRGSSSRHQASISSKLPSGLPASNYPSKHELHFSATTGSE